VLIKIFIYPPPHGVPPVVRLLLAIGSTNICNHALPKLSSPNSGTTLGEVKTIQHTSNQLSFSPRHR